ncbi:MAG: hypothetical protein KAX37_04975 [Opitutaceae bacterium]|nr:hypothetical protein [Opitutaceae bacterium]
MREQKRGISESALGIQPLEPPPVRRARHLFDCVVRLSEDPEFQMAALVGLCLKVLFAFGFRLLLRFVGSRGDPGPGAAG